jgi:hypothetical protein
MARAGGSGAKNLGKTGKISMSINLLTAGDPIRHGGSTRSEQ